MRNSYGFSLVEVMVGLALAGIVTLSLASGINNGLKGQKHIESLEERTRVDQNLDMIFSSSAICAQAFQDDSGNRIFFDPTSGVAGNFQIAIGAAPNSDIFLGTTGNAKSAAILRRDNLELQTFTLKPVAGAPAVSNVDPLLQTIPAVLTWQYKKVNPQASVGVALLKPSSRYLYVTINKSTHEFVGCVAQLQDPEAVCSSMGWHWDRRKQRCGMAGDEIARRSCQFYPAGVDSETKRMASTPVAHPLPLEPKDADWFGPSMAGQSAWCTDNCGCADGEVQVGVDYSSPNVAGHIFGNGYDGTPNSSQMIATCSCKKL